MDLDLVGPIGSSQGVNCMARLLILGSTLTLYGRDRATGLWSSIARARNLR